VKYETLPQKMEHSTMPTKYCRKVKADVTQLQLVKITQFQKIGSYWQALIEQVSKPFKPK